jgi:hypothetical protein
MGQRNLRAMISGPQKKKGGRPSIFSKAILDEICSRLQEGETMTSICREERMPSVQTVSNWMAADEAVSVSIARARGLGYDAIADDAMRIADDRGDDPASRRVRVETRLKLLAKWCPKRYGEQLQIEHTGTVRAVIGGEDA